MIISLSSFPFLPRWVFMETLDETPDEGYVFFFSCDQATGYLCLWTLTRSQEAWCSSLGALPKDEEVEISETSVENW